MMRRTLFAFVAVLVLATASATLAGSVAAEGPAFPDIIPLPDGFQPEGIVSGRGTTLYAGSLADGSIYRANARTGEGEILVPPQENRIAVGLAYDSRSNLIWVAGGPSGEAYAYDARSGASVATYQLTTEASFVNDVIVTREAAYFTDSFRPVFYRVPLGPGGAPVGPAEEIPLSGDFVFVPGGFNGNGIEATPSGDALIIVNSSRGELYRVDPSTGEATLIDLGSGAVFNGDGLLYEGSTLYVVQNRLNQIAVIDLAPDLASGEIVNTITDPAFRVPTTVAGFGSSLYAVNARFGTPPTPTTDYEIVRVSK